MAQPIPLTIIIYSNDGKEVLWSNGWSDVTNCDVMVGYIPYGGSTYFQASFILQGGNDNNAIGGMHVYGYEGDGDFKGFSYEPNSAIVEIPEGEFLDWDNEDGTNIARLYVVDGAEKVRVYFGEDIEEGNHIIDIAKGETGVLKCKEKLMYNDIYIRALTYGENNLVEVRLGEEKILEIPSGQTGVLLCKDKIMREEVYIQYVSLEE